MSVSWEIRDGDALERLREMPDASVQCCVTSPPYFGLRDYGTGEWDGGEDSCDHRATNYDRGERADRGNVMERTTPYRDTCGKCGARRTDRQIGLEATPDEFVARLVEVFREVRRVLRDDGTLWLNIGDSYSGSGPSGASYQSKTTLARAEGNGTDGNFKVSKRLESRGLTYAEKKPVPVDGTKAKDLLGIPWLLAFALRADGWYLRSDIIWAKPNPMPESVTDRPTSAHEHVFLLSKSARYAYDADAIREPHADKQGLERFALSGGSTNGYEPDHQGWVDGGGFKMQPGAREYNPAGRNRRNVWEIATQPYADAHFATFPCKLVEPCILAGSSPKACGECGAPWVRVVERNEAEVVATDRRVLATGGAISGGTARSTLDGAGGWGARTLGWQPSCAHDDDTGHSIILDPFAGSGTTGLVALRHDRSFIGVELSPAYAEMARNRIRDDAPLLNTPAEAAA